MSVRVGAGGVCASGDLPAAGIWPDGICGRGDVLFLLVDAVDAAAATVGTERVGDEVRLRHSVSSRLVFLCVGLVSPAVESVPGLVLMLVLVPMPMLMLMPMPMLEHAFSLSLMVGDDGDMSVSFGGLLVSYFKLTGKTATARETRAKTVKAWPPNGSAKGEIYRGSNSVPAGGGLL